MKKLIVIFVFLLTVSCKGVYVTAPCETYDSIRTAHEWKKLHSNKKKSPHLYKTFRYNKQ